MKKLISMPVLPGDEPSLNVIPKGDRNVEKVRKGSWVQIEWTLLEPGERAEHLPPETRRVPLRMRAKGCLQEDAFIGETASILTTCGRKLTGVLAAENPPYTHSFGSQIPEFIGLGDFLRSIWRQ